MNKTRSKDLTMMAICLALLVVCSKISIPIGSIPLTLQTFAVFIIALVLGVKKSVIVFITYIVMGLIGIPVFSTGGGIQYVFMPSFGFIIGFLLAAPVIGIGSKSNQFYTKYIVSIIGLLIINISGVIYMYLIFNYYKNVSKDLLNIIQIGVLPFIVKDIFTAILSCLIYSRIKVLLYKDNKCNELLLNDTK
ncbi:MAG: biotin transporter BioY [Acholeplasmatales bacterium]|nr:biotin transporter BioY [Acholeplasmatales bacterium]